MQPVTPSTVRLKSGNRNETLFPLQLHPIRPHSGITAVVWVLPQASGPQGLQVMCIYGNIALVALLILAPVTFVMVCKLWTLITWR